jgi:septal ring-binding cell division protein DamX
MRKYTGPALFAIVLGALVMAASPAWAQERASDGDPSRDIDIFTCPEGYSPVANPGTQQGFTCVDDPVDPETGEPVEESTTTVPPAGDDDDADPPGPTATTSDDGVDVPRGTLPGGSSNPCREVTVPASPNWEDSDLVRCVRPTTTTSDEAIVPTTTSGVGTVGREAVVKVTSPAPTTTVQAGEGELPFTGTGSAVLVAGLVFLAVGATVFLVARVKPKH